MTRGKVKWFDVDRGFGFIETGQGRDVFVHYSAIQGQTGFRQLGEGIIVEFDLTSTDKGPRAENVIVMGLEQEV